MRGTTILPTNWLIVFALAALVAATLFATGAFLRTATAATARYVATSGTDAGPNDCLTEGSPCLTIGYAIGQAASGDTVNLAAGTYDVDTVINVDVANLTISGDKGNSFVDGSGKDGSIVDGGDVLFNVSASGVTIENLNIDLGDDTTDFDVGIFTPNDASVDDLTVRNNTMRFAAFGNPIGEQLIHLGGGTGNMVDDNDLETASANSTIYVGDNTNVALTIQNNTIAPDSDADGGGTAINSFGPVTATSTISGNTFTKTGIAVYLGADFFGSTTATDGVGVTGNTFTDTTSGAWGAVVIAAEVDGTTTSNITVTGNSFSGGAGDAVLVRDFGATGDVDASTVDINYNDFDGTNGAGVNVVGVTGTVDAEKNWWGDATGADHPSNPHGTGQGGDTASNNVDFTPWYATETTTSGTENVSVTHNPVIALSDTIQGAIDAALAGDTLDVSAGTYSESVTIDKSLTLTGDPGATGKGDVGPGGSAPILDGTGLGNTSAIILDAGVSDVTIEGFVIRNYANPSGPPPGNACATYITGGTGSAIESWNSTASNITIQDNYLHHLGWNGVLVGSDNATLQTGWLVQRNLVEDVLYAAIELTNATDSQVLDNVVTARTVCVGTQIDAGDSGVGIEIAARDQSSLGVVAGTNILVDNNTVTGALFERAGINILARGYSGTASATLSGVTVSNNSVTGTQGRAGILVVSEGRTGAASVTGLLVDSNTLDGNEDGVQIEDVTGGAHGSIVVTGNDIINSTGASSGVRIRSGTSATGVTVNYNTIVGNALLGVNHEGTDTLDAENNWWGACSGPSGVGPGSGDAVSANVDYDPWNAGKCDKDNDLLTDDEEIFIYGTDPNNPDTDGDGCLDGAEVLPKSIVANGGGRDPLNPWDFYDVAGLEGEPDGVVDLVLDILGVILHYSLDGSSPYDVQFDRGPSAGPNPWNMTAPDGSIDLFIDILGVIKQYGHDCT